MTKGTDIVCHLLALKFAIGKLNKFPFTSEHTYLHFDLPLESLTQVPPFLQVISEQGGEKSHSCPLCTALSEHTHLYLLGGMLTHKALGQISGLSSSVLFDLQALCTENNYYDTYEVQFLLFKIIPAMVTCVLGLSNKWLFHLK